MGKKIIWSPTSLRQLEEVHADIFEVSKSLNTADGVVNDIMDSVDVLSSQSEIYTLDENKYNNDGTLPFCSKKSLKGRTCVWEVKQ